MYRAPFGGVDFSLFLTGRTGTFKTALATLCQQHFGAAMDASRLPANFASTANALEELAFSAKDALLVVDDFAPTGGVGDSALYAVAERLFRAAGNHQGRSRMGGHGTLARFPTTTRAGVGDRRRSTARAQPARPTVDRGGEAGRGGSEALSECQRAGKEGLFAAAMGAYLVWIAGRYEELQERLRARVSELRSLVHKGSTPVHARLPTTLAELQAGWEIWLQFALEVGAISRTEREPAAATERDGA